MNSCFPKVFEGITKGATHCHGVMVKLSYFKGSRTWRPLRKAVVLGLADTCVLLLTCQGELLDCYSDEDLMLAPVHTQGFEAPWILTVGWWSHCAGVQLAELRAEGKQECLYPWKMWGWKPYLWQRRFALLPFMLLVQSFGGWFQLCGMTCVDEHLWRETKTHIGSPGYSLWKKSLFLSLQ